MSSPRPYSSRRSISCTGASRRSAAQWGYGSRSVPAWACSNALKGSVGASVIASRFSPQLLTEVELLHLARRRAREVVDEPQLLRALLAGEAGCREVGLHGRQCKRLGTGQ